MRRLLMLCAAIAALMCLACTEEDLWGKMSTMEGRIVRVEYIAATSSLGPDVIKTVIRFDDGRIKVFEGIVGELREGSYYRFRYDARDRIRAITRVDHP